MENKKTSLEEMATNLEDLINQEEQHIINAPASFGSAFSNWKKKHEEISKSIDDLTDEFHKSVSTEMPDQDRLDKLKSKLMTNVVLEENDTEKKLQDPLGERLLKSAEEQVTISSNILSKLQAKRAEERVGGASWGAETALGQDKELQKIGEYQKEYLHKFGKWPTAKEVDSHLSGEDKKDKQDENQTEVQVQKQTKTQSR